jgi:hypothetical protein
MPTPEVLLGELGRLRPSLVAELGCGDAPLQPRLAHLLPTTGYVGVDLDQAALRRAARQLRATASTSGSGCCAPTCATCPWQRPGWRPPSPRRCCTTSTTTSWTPPSKASHECSPLAATSSSKTAPGSARTAPAR